jgi:uncharacterized membrane protein
MLPNRWYLLILFVLVLLLVSLVQIGIISIAFEKLGLSPGAGLLLVSASLLGSTVNIPVYRTGRWRSGADLHQPFERGPGDVGSGMLIAANLGGCVIPVGVSVYLFTVHPLGLLSILTGLLVVSAVSFSFSELIPGVGIGMPLFLAPLVSAVTALLLDPQHSAPLAYISGTMGVLIGADLLHLPDVHKLQAPLASVGGAGTFDGIFITGIVAALLA